MELLFLLRYRWNGSYSTPAILVDVTFYYRVIADAAALSTGRTGHHHEVATVFSNWLVSVRRNERTHFLQP